MEGWENGEGGGYEKIEVRGWRGAIGECAGKIDGDVISGIGNEMGMRSWGSGSEVVTVFMM